MAGIVLPWFGPLVPLMSIVGGVLAASSFVVPSSVRSPTVTVYLSSVMTSVMLLRIWSGNGLPAISAVTGFQVPCNFLASSFALLSSPRANEPTQTQTSTDQPNRRFTGFLLPRVSYVAEPHKRNHR